MRRPTCTGPSPETAASDSGRWICDGLVPMPITCRLAEQLATAPSLDALHVALFHVEHSFTHCRIDGDQVAALRSLHGRTWREIAARELDLSPLVRSVRMLARS